MDTRWAVVVAGEVSGDRMAAPVVRELGRRRPDLSFFGAGGQGLEAAGVEIRHPIGGLAVTGFSEALGRAPAALALLTDLTRQTRRRRPALALLVDYPGVNLRLAGMLHRHGVPVVYYGAPQRWAWLEWRTSTLRCVDRIAVTLPFEEGWFRQRGVAAHFVGNPVLDLFAPPTREEARRRLGLTDEAPVLALLPGSRDNEIRRHLPPFVEALRRLPRLQPVLAVPPGGRHLCHALVRGAGVVCSDARHVLAAADVALCASGTATLELAMAGVPGVVVYRVSPLTFAVARRLVRVPAVGLPNLILGRRVLPELLQGAVSPRRLAREVQRLLEPDLHRRTRLELGKVVSSLGGPGVAGRVVDLAAGLLRSRGV